MKQVTVCLATSSQGQVGPEIRCEVTTSSPQLAEGQQITE